MRLPSRIASWAAAGAVAVAALSGTLIQAQTAPPVNLALNKPALASAIENNDPTVAPEFAVDGALGTRWSSGAAGEQWWAVDLGSTQTIGSIRINWETAYATDYEILVSPSALPADSADVDLTNGWTSVAHNTIGDGGLDILGLPAGTQARSLAVSIHTGAIATYSFYEFQAFAEHGGGVSGVVSGPGGPLAGAVVKVTGADNLQTTTNDQGQYAFAALLTGDYILTAYQPGKLAPVTQPVTLTENQNLTQNIALATPVTLTPFAFPYATADWIAMPNEVLGYSNKIFDTAFDSSTLPTDNPTMANGIPFSLGSSATGANNVFAVSGASFAVPAGAYSAIHTLASSAGGTYDGTVTLGYSDGTTESVIYRVSDWFGAPANGEIIGIEVNQRLNADGAPQDVGSNIRIFQFYIPANPSKTLQTVSFSAPAASSSTTTKPYLFGITLESTAPLPAPGTVSGVVNGNGTPLVGATVRVGPYTLTTGAGGAFSLPNVAAGTYTVTAFRTGQFAPVSQDVTVTPGGTATVTLNLTVKPTFFQYPLAYTNDWASSHETPGDYFGADTAYPAAGDGNTTLGHGLPDAGPFTPQGMNVVFTFPTTSLNHARNTVLVDNQVMPVPAGRYSALYLLESCGWGSVNGPILLTYADGTTEKVSATFTDWFGNPSAKEVVAWTVDHRHSATDPLNSSGSQIKVFAETLPVNSTKVLKSITLPPDPAGYTTQTAFLWAMTLEAVDTLQTGTVTGTVTGPGGPVANAVVSLSGFGQIMTDAAGAFTINNAPVGAYSLQVVAPNDANLSGTSVSVNVTQGQSVNANVPALVAGPTQVFSALGASNFEGGLTQLENATKVANSKTTVTEVAGKSGRTLAVGRRMYFNVDDSFLRDNTTVTPVYVQVSYYDKETLANPTNPSTLRLHYNSSDPMISDYDPRYAHTNDTYTAPLENTATWKTVTWELPDAGFYNTLELGGDFYLEAQRGPITVGSVIVSKSATIGPIPTPACKPGDVNGDAAVNVSDAVIALKAAAKLITLTDAQTKAADVVAGGGVNVADAVKILRVAAKLDTLPAACP